MYFRVNLKMKKPTLFPCFTWIVFFELNFIVAFLLRWGLAKKWGVFLMGVDIPCTFWVKWGDEGF